MILEELKALRQEAIKQFEATVDLNTTIDLAFVTLAEHRTKLPPGSFFKANYPVELTYTTHKVSRYHPANDSQYLGVAHKSFVQSLLLQHQASLFEHVFFDALRLLLLDRPSRLPKKKQLDYATIIASHSREDVIEAMVDREIHSLSYSGPRDWLDYLTSLAGSVTVAEEDIDAIVEIKATRDLLVHNRGIVNSIYLEKSGSRARGTFGTPIPTPPSYTYAAWTVQTRVVLAILDALIAAEGPSAPARTA